MSYGAGAPLCGDATKANAAGRRHVAIGLINMLIEAGA